MILSYRQLEMALSLYLGIHPDRVPTFRARIKQFQRLQFPSGVNVGRGTKMHYSGEHLFKLATAFELVALGQPALTASNLVEANWNKIAAGYGIAIRNEYYEWPHDKQNHHVSIYLRITQNTLAALFGGDEAELINGYVSVEHRQNMIEHLEDDPEREGNSFLLLCASHIMRGILQSCSQARIESPFDDSEFEEWYKLDSPHAWWMYGDGNEFVNVPHD